MPYKSKIFANHFISSRNMEEVKIFEQVIQRRLMGAITEDEFREVLHRPFNKGGVGFDKRTVEKIIKRVNRILKMAYYIYQEDRQRKNEQGEHEKVSFEEKVKKTSEYLLKTCYNKYYQKLSEEQINRLQSAISLRLKHQYQKHDFFVELDKPYKDGGVGLNSKTARLISEELELILILGFGIVKTITMHREDYERQKKKKQNKSDENTQDKKDNKKIETSKKNKDKQSLSLADYMAITQHREKEIKKRDGKMDF